MPLRKTYTKKRATTAPSKTSKALANRKSDNKDWRFKQINTNHIKPEPFPRVLYTRAKFSDRILMTNPSPDISVANSYRLNSIYDPRFAVGGRTVVGHGNFSNLYGRYLVTGAKVSISFNDPNQSGCRVGCRLRINGTNAANGQTIQALSEQPMTYMSGLNDSGSQKKTFNLFVRPWSLMGLSRLEYMANTTKYSSQMLANPTEDNCFLDVYVANPGVSASVNCVIRIMYYVQLYDRNKLTSSAF